MGRVLRVLRPVYSVIASVITIVTLLGKRERSTLLGVVLRKLYLERRVGGRHSGN